MSCEVKTVREFDKEFKRLSKKYRSLREDLMELVEALIVNPTHGVSLGGSIYKIRLKITSKGKGKSGGGRVITYVQVEKADNENKVIYLLGIFDKSAIESISIEYYQSLIQLIKLDQE